MTTSKAPTPITSSAAPSGPIPFTIPTFSSGRARDDAFLGEVAPLESWALGYDITEEPIKDFRRDVLKQAHRVCKFLISGYDVEEIVKKVAPFTDLVDGSAFVLATAEFYCPTMIGAVTSEVYVAGDEQPQVEDCPTAKDIEISANVLRSGTSATYRYTLTNRSTHRVLFMLQERWEAAGWKSHWEGLDDPDAFDILSIFNLKSGETQTRRDERGGAYEWRKVALRVEPGQFLAIDCGYVAGGR